jgi:hypothetical protein
VSDWVLSRFAERPEAVRDLIDRARAAAEEVVLGAA